MDNSTYRLHWFLVVVGDYITMVCGGALQDMADKAARERGGRVVHIGAYGMPYHAGQRFIG